ncbi:hypothetical protein ABKV19_025239, partial [Rosa sericea]
MQLGSVTLFFLFIFSLLPSQYGAEVYNITSSHSLSDGETLVSPGLIYELGFFSPKSSANKYLGLWHKSIFPRKCVWVANRDNALADTDTLASLRIGSSGSLELVDGKQSSFWSTNPFTLVDNETQGTRYFSFSFDKIPGDNVLAYGAISSDGILSFMFSESGKNWYPNFESWENPCDNYGACGPFGVCKPSESPICKCLKGFIPKSNEEWSKGNWTGGCVRRTNLFEDCEIQCLSNCSCLAYAFVENIGCLVWFKDLIDMQHFPSFGEDLYVRLAHSELGEGKAIKLIASLTAIGFMSILVAIVFSLHRWRANQKHVELTARRLRSTSMIKIHRDGIREYIGKHDPSELKIYDFDSILIATDNFSITNKLGQGGFGPVYKGMLPEGKEIAVKRLSTSSGQGVEEFKNEMLLISNLQHKNLVRMMGCSVKEDEKLLIYEFMPNKSLDTFLY